MKDFIKEKLRENIDQLTEFDPSKIRIKKQIINNLIVFSPFYGDEKMGGFRLKPYNDDVKITGTVLYDRFKGKGIGSKMYGYIIKTMGREGKSVYSDDNQSPDAQKVWNSLINKGLAVKTENGYKSINL